MAVAGKILYLTRVPRVAVILERPAISLGRQHVTLYPWVTNSYCKPYTCLFDEDLQQKYACSSKCVTLIIC